MPGPEKRTENHTVEDERNFDEVLKQAYEQHQTQQQRYADQIKDAQKAAKEHPDSDTFGDEINRKQFQVFENMLARLEKMREKDSSLSKALAFAESNPDHKLKNYTQEEFDQLTLDQQFSLRLARIAENIYGDNENSLVNNLEHYLHPVFPEGPRIYRERRDCLKRIHAILEAMEEPGKEEFRLPEAKNGRHHTVPSGPKQNLAGRLDRCMLYEQADEPWFREFYASLKDLQLQTDSLSEGRLMVPSRGSHDMDNRHFIRVNDAEAEKRAARAKGSTRKKAVTENPSTTRITLNTNGKKKKERTEYSADTHAQDPLFTHMPVPDDIEQGSLGDCYLLASLSSLAAEDPEKILDAMHDNGDGTVTVRFFDDADTPVFVTVDKTTVIYRIKDADGKEYTREAYAKGELWVKMFEKAYAASGLHKNGTKKISGDKDLPDTETKEKEQVQSMDSHGYKGIITGSAAEFLPRIVGHRNSGIKEESEIVPTLSRMLTYSGDYCQYENYFYDRIRTAVEQGAFVTAASKSGGTKDKRKGLGIVGHHTYTVLGAVPGEKNKKYIRIRNPHASYGRDYDENGKAKFQENPERRGESLIELREFLRVFEEAAIVKCTVSPEVRSNAPAIDAFRKSYGKAAMDCCRQILDMDSGLLNFFKLNRDGYNAMRRAASDFKMSYNAGSPDLHQLQQNLQTLVRSAAEYKAFRDANVRSPKEESGTRAVARYHAADMLTRLGEILHQEQEKPEYQHSEISVLRLEQETLHAEEHASLAKQCTDEKVQAEMQKRAAEQDRKIKELRLKLQARDDFQDLKNGAARQMKKAIADKDRKGMVRSGSLVLYGESGCRLCSRLPEQKIEAMRTQRTAVKEIRSLEPHVQELCRSLSKEEKNALLNSREPADILLQAEKKLQEAKKNGPENPPSPVQEQSRNIEKLL